MDDVKTDLATPDKPVFLYSFNRATPNDILQKPDATVRKTQDKSDKLAGCSAWEVDGATFPHGTKFRGKYKGYYYYGKVDNGAFMLNGRKFLSPCAAALTITRNPVNGWLFWDFKLPAQSFWTSIFKLKNNEYR